MTRFRGPANRKDRRSSGYFPGVRTAKTLSSGRKEVAGDKTVAREYLMSDDRIEELFEIVRQHETHIRTLQMLMEFASVIQTRSRVEPLAWSPSFEERILQQIEEAANSEADPTLSDYVCKAMSEIVVEFFHNVRSR
jgi:hypothetical protein